MTDHPSVNSKIEIETTGKTASSPISMDECASILAQPGTIRALRAYSSDAFSTLFRRALSNAQNYRGEPEGTNHIKLVAQIARELESDPLKLQITPPKIDQRLSYMEKKHAKNQFTCWNSFIQLLSSPHLQGDDWMTVFRSLANSVEGKEREDGMNLVKEAISRVDMAVQAIEAFPRLFRSARGEAPEETSLMLVAKGEANYALWRHEAACAVPGAAIELGAKIVQALRSVKVKETDSLLLFYASLADYYKNTLSAEVITFGIFKVTHGLDSLMASKSADGVPTLMWAAVNAPTNDPEGPAEHLLKLGFDPNIRDSLNQKTLPTALRVLQKSAALLHVFANHGAIASEDVLELSKSPDAIMDPESRAYIASRHATLMIDEMMARKASSGLGP